MINYYWIKTELLVGFLLVSTLSVFAQRDSTDIRLINDARAASNNAIAKKDIETLSNFWLPDFVQVRGNGTSMSEKDSIVKIWVDLFKTNSNTSFIRTPTEIIINETNPTMAWEQGTWLGINSYSKGGKYSAMWRKNENVWKLQAELFVSLK